MWKFDQPKNCASIISQSILRGERSILLVIHDPEDDGWMFPDGEAFEAKGAAVVGLGSVVELDPSVLKVAEIPSGWQAFRSDSNSEWVIEKSAEE